MKAIKLNIGSPIIVGDEPSLSTQTPDESHLKIHGEVPTRKIKAFGNSGTHTRLTNKQMVKRKRKLKKRQRQMVQAR